jgi:aminoglycoside/choline kinase family phosphotransferase
LTLSDIPDAPRPGNFCIVPQAGRTGVLLLQGKDGWALPETEGDEAADIRRELGARFGVDVTVLGTVYGHYIDDEHEEAHQVFALERHGTGEALPDGARWVGSDELAGLALAAPEHRPVIARWMRETETGSYPPLRVPWARPGWLPETTAWIDDCLAELGRARTGPPEQVRVRHWACVLRVPAAGGDIYFKAVAPAQGFEPLVTRALMVMAPGVVPRVLALDAERGWLLMVDGGVPLRGRVLPGRHLEPLLDMLPRFAALQLALVPHTAALLAAGCPDRRLHRLPALIADLLDDRDLMLVGHPDGMTAAEHADLRAALPAMRDLCARLADIGVPESLHHDDFHPGNVLVDARANYAFFDWGESAITHPFLSLGMALRWARLVLECDEEALDRLRRAYLGPWTAYAPTDRLLEAAAIAERLMPLARALTWAESIRGLEPDARWECEDSSAYFLRVFLGTAA